VVAARKGITPFQLAIAGVLARGGSTIPLASARRCDWLREAVGALDVHLTAEALARIDQAIRPQAVAGDGYRAE
jgi:aryl-alcohol dehydrogenase-like predicted oxidoreductase